jgi:cation diffusion facilitator CzcD-associated flavoprotein CzcO
VITEVDVAIVGAGFAGLCMAIRLQQEGRRSYVVLEKAGGLGGTWRDNHYPGCACDVPSHLYSFSFEPNPGWSRVYAPQAEILAYLERCADRYGVRPHLRFHAEVESAELDERAALWRVRLAGGDEVRARHLVFGMGALSRPAIPAIAGLDRFQGKTFHSAAWDHGYDLEGKTVGVVGTGASAIQFVPRIVPRAGRLHLFQRTPPWIVPRRDHAIDPARQRLFEAAPLTQRLYRYLIYAGLEARGLGFTFDPRIMKLAERIGRAHIRAQIRSPELRRAVTPAYTLGCKRILLADDYYPALEQPNVEVVTEAIREVTPRGVVTADGQERALDALILGTGFRVTDLLTPMRVLGRGGVDVNDAWREGIEAYRGTTIAGYPNLYMLAGPNTGLGHSSMVFMIEAQVDYILACMRALDRRGARSADVLPGAQAAFNRRIQARLGKTVWSSGCRSWYLDANGRNSTLWPGSTVEFWLQTRRMIAGDHVFD